MGWRDHADVHPAAALFDNLSPDELEALAASIDSAGQRETVKLRRRHLSADKKRRVIEALLERSGKRMRRIADEVVVEDRAVRAGAGGGGCATGGASGR